MSAKELLPLIGFVSVVVVIVSTAVAAYVLSRRGGIVRSHGSWTAAAVWILIALVATIWFGQFVLLDFQIPGTSSKQLALESMVLSAICFPLWFLAVRRTFQALAKAKPSPEDSIPT